MSKFSFIPVILQANVVVLERFAEQISLDYKLDIKDVRKRYFGDLKEYKKKPSRRKGRVNAYAAFLGDDEVEAELRAQCPKGKTLTFGELSKKKGPMWKELSKERRAYYKIKALELTAKNLENLNKDKEEEDVEEDSERLQNAEEVVEI